MAAGFRRRFRLALPALWVLLLIATAAELPFEAAAVAGRFTAAGDVLSTTFGHWWTLAAVLAVVLGLPVWALARRTRVANISPAAWVVTGGVLMAGLAVVTGMNGHARTNRLPGLAVTSIAVHLMSVSLWVGGLGALVFLAGPSWRQQPPERRAPFLGRLVRRFSRIAIGAVILVILTGTVNSLADFGSVSDLWKVGYGRVVLAKIVLLVIALAIAAWHLFVVPKRLAGGEATAAVGRFEQSSTAELGVLFAAVALAAALVAMVPGRSVALAGTGQVNQERRAGSYTVQLFVDPSRVGDNEIHVTFVNSQGLAAAEVVNLAVTVSAKPVEMRLISPGHFVGDTTLPTKGAYHVNAAAPQASTTFVFALRKGAGS